YSYADAPALHSSPTRRSSDLGRPAMRRSLGAGIALVVLAAIVAAPPAPRDAATAPSFDADAAWREVVRLVDLGPRPAGSAALARDRKSTRLNSSHLVISYAGF